MENKMKAEFPSLSCNERLARVVAAAFAMELDPTLDQLSEIKTAVSEAVTNAVIHGYANSMGTIILEGEITEEDRVCFTVTDYGRGIADIEKAREPLYTGAPEMERSGMGFTIMETFMDEVTVESSPGQGTRIVMAKSLKKEQGEGDGQ